MIRDSGLRVWRLDLSFSQQRPRAEQKGVQLSERKVLTSEN